MTLRKLRHSALRPQNREDRARCVPARRRPLPVPTPPKPKRQGHGRTKAQDYTGARWVQVPHPQLQAGAQLSALFPRHAARAEDPRRLLLRIVGSPPISATGYAMERLRCDTCGAVFTAPTPPEAGTRKV